MINLSVLTILDLTKLVRGCYHTSCGTFNHVVTVTVVSTRALLVPVCFIQTHAVQSFLCHIGSCDSGTLVL